MRRGEIWQALGDFEVLAIGNREVYDRRDDIVVVPLLPDLRLGQALTLPKVGERFAHCALLSVVDKHQFNRKTGEARDSELEAVLTGVRIVLGL